MGQDECRESDLASDNLCVLPSENMHILQMRATAKLRWGCQNGAWCWRDLRNVTWTADKERIERNKTLIYALPQERTTARCIPVTRIALSVLVLFYHTYEYNQDAALDDKWTSVDGLAA